MACAKFGITVRDPSLPNTTITKLPEPDIVRLERRDLNPSMRGKRPMSTIDKLNLEQAQEMVDDILKLDLAHAAAKARSIEVRTTLWPKYYAKLNNLLFTLFSLDAYQPGLHLDLSKTEHHLSIYQGNKSIHLYTYDCFTYFERGIEYGDHIDLIEIRKRLAPSFLDKLKLKISAWLEKKQSDTYDLV